MFSVFSWHSKICIYSTFDTTKVILIFNITNVILNITKLTYQSYSKIAVVEKGTLTSTVAVEFAYFKGQQEKLLPTEIINIKIPIKIKQPT